VCGTLSTEKTPYTDVQLSYMDAMLSSVRKHLCSFAVRGFFDTKRCPATRNGIAVMMKISNL